MIVRLLFQVSSQIESNMKSPAQWFDIKSAVLGALLMGGVVGLVNVGHGLDLAMIAAAKQAGYTFFVAGFIMQFCRWIAGRIERPNKAIAAATLIPTVITVVAVYALHSYKGTPEPELSTIPVVILCLLAFFTTARNLVTVDPLVDDAN